GAIVEQVNWLVRFQIEQQGAVTPLLLSQREIINAQNARSTLLIIVVHGVEQTEQRIGAGGHAGFLRQASTPFAAGLQCKRDQQLGRVIGTPGVVGQYSIEALGEDLAWALWHVAKPTSAVDTKAH